MLFADSLHFLKSVVDSLSDSPIDFGAEVEHSKKGVTDILIYWVYL